MASKGPECSICFERYNDNKKCPRLLSCGHSFCSSCLERLLHGNTIDCPTCRNPVAVPSGVVGLLKNFALLDIVNETTQQQAGSTSSHECEACDEQHPATFCCLDCKEDMCKTAAQFHTRNKASRDHRVVTLEELKANPKLASVSLVCQKHNDKFRFFDEECDRVVCRECVVLEHFGHACLPLAVAASRCRQEVKDLIEETNVLFEETKTAEGRVEAASLALKKAYEKGFAEIQSFFKELHTALLTREQQLKAELSAINMEKVLFLRAQHERLDSSKKILESVKKRAESTIQSSGSAELLISILDVKCELLDAIENQQAESEPKTDSELSFLCDREYFLDLVLKAGKIRGDKITLEEEYMQQFLSLSDARVKRYLVS